MLLIPTVSACNIIDNGYLLMK